MALQFSWEFNNDPAIPAGRTAALMGINAIDTPDYYTAIFHWKVTTNQGNLIARNDFHIHPEHIVRPLWEAHEIDPLLAHPFFHEGFVGLGPYKIDRWTDDGTVTIKRFDDFFLGTPKIGTMVHHTTSNALGVLTLLLAGQIHRTSRNGLGFEEGLIAKDQWEAKGEGTVFFEPVGWRRGTDGVLANAAGERFEIPFMVPAGDNEQVQLQTALAGFWSEIGIRTRIENATDAQLRDRQFRETFPGTSMTDSGPTIASLPRRWGSSQIPNAENRYVGDNPAHWSNAQADRIFERMDNTFRPQDMEPLLVEFAQVYSEEMPALTLFYTPEVTATHKYLKGARPRPAGSGQNTWNWSAYQ